MRALGQIALTVGVAVLRLGAAAGNLFLVPARAAGATGTGLIMAGVAALAPLSILAWTAVISLPFDDPIQRTLIEADARSMAVEVIDRDHNYLGMIHPRASPTDDYIQVHDLWADSPELQQVISDYDIHPDHSAVHLTPSEVPPFFWGCLRQMEDRGQGSWREPAGIDWLSPVAAALTHRGGSTLPMQFGRIMRQMPPRPDETTAEKLQRKVVEWREAPALWRLLGGHKSAPALQVWSAEHVHLVFRLGNGNATDIPSEVYGLQNASRVLFGREANQLTPAQQIVLAGAYKSPLIAARPDPELDPDRAESAARRWDSVTRRVEAQCADNPTVIPAAVAPQVRDELARLRESPPVVAISPALLTAITELGETSSAPVSRTRLEHPYALLRRAVPRPHRRFVTDQMLERFGRNWRDQVRRIDLTTSATEDLRFQGEMAASWRAFREAHASGWLVSPDSGKMGYLAVAADLDGHIVRFYEGGDVSETMAPRLPFDGGSARYDPFTDEGRGAVGDQLRAVKCAAQAAPGALRNVCPFQLRTAGIDRRGRSIASTGKVLAAIALADGKVPMTPRLKTAFAKSNNEVIAAYLRGLDQDRLAALAAAFGIEPQPGVPLPTAISRGEADATPRQLQRLAAAAMAIASGDFSRPALLPSLVASYGIYDPLLLTARDAPADPFDGAVDLRRLLLRTGGATPDAMQHFVAQALSAPACGGGTLRALADWCPGHHPGVAMLLAKTGTRANRTIHDDGGKETVDIWLTGAVRFTDGRAFSFVLLAGTDEPASPFHTGLNAAAAAPVLARLLASLEAHPSLIPTPRPAAA